KGPFNGKSAVDVVVKHNTMLPVPPRQLRADVPDRLEKVILRALEKQQENRQDSAAQLAEELESVLFDFGVPLKDMRRRAALGGRAGVGGSKKESVRTKAFESGPPQDQVTAEALTEPQTLPVPGKQTGNVVNQSDVETLPQQRLETAPLPRSRIYLYAALAVVVLAIGVFAVIKLMGTGTSSLGRKTGTDGKPPAGMIFVKGSK